MHVAQVAPLYESIPPKLYGGTERVVSYLTEELVRQGHEVTLFASADSKSRARLHPVCKRSLRLEGENVTDPIAFHMRMLAMVARHAQEFDIIHYHTGYIHFPSTSLQDAAAVTTMHGRLDLPEVIDLIDEFSDLNLVSISNSQRQPLAWVNWVATVHHGLPEDLYQPSLRPGNYLAFLGRISPEKRVDRAIEIARRAGIPLKIAAKVDPADQDYFDTKIKALFSDPIVEYVGEIGEADKSDFLGNAWALLFPIDWPEPFGLVMIEAMACGTPVVAYRLASVPEILEDGQTGFLVNSIEQAVEAVQRAGSIDREVCRRTFERRFSVKRMCLDYVRVYTRVIAEHSTRVEKAPLAGANIAGRIY
ncbi:MAG TPA: glycosyltransferase family 4 protein [Blastocatellia bacterium]|nr:glycosyltransferase family 4 protein [Blastocatellia bacterium]